MNYLGGCSGVVHFFANRGYQQHSLYELKNLRTHCKMQIERFFFETKYPNAEAESQELLRKRIRSARDC